VHTMRFSLGCCWRRVNNSENTAQPRSDRLGLAIICSLLYECENSLPWHGIGAVRTSENAVNAKFAEFPF
jgi:hypothetical protein